MSLERRRSSDQKSRQIKMLEQVLFTKVYQLLRKLAPAATVSATELGELGVQFGQRVEEIGDEAEIRDLEDRRFLILVDRDDDLGIFNPGEVLDGS